MHRFAAIFSLFLAAFAGGCSRQSVEAAGERPASRTVSISTAPAETRVVPASFEVTGTFAADETSDVAPLVAGRVMATPANTGDFVRQGQTLCELDHRDAQLRVDQARAQRDEAESALRQAQSRIGASAGAKFDPNTMPEVAAARANYESALALARLAGADSKRYENLVASGDVSRSAFDRAHTQQETAEAQAHAAKQQYEAALNGARQGWGGVEMAQAALEAAKAQLAQAEKALSDTTIRAPFDGFVTARPAAVGAYLNVGMKIVTLVRIGTLKLQLQAPEQRAALTKLGMSVVARISAYPDRDFTGRVTAVNPAVDPASRVFVIEARFDNPAAELKPGMFATAHVMLPGGENAVFVPKSAVLRDKTTDSWQLFTVDHGVARLRVVLAGETIGDAVRVNSGLNGGETVATSHVGDLFDGAQVAPRS
ncbi:MAG TPA: efflux RND transporter periplasmic adaptor subunit [Bryobacteraceae bacterium]|nr:efflux RND transporter periplasmic adaptor subunit [Bryobacteraceae bacterium]